MIHSFILDACICRGEKIFISRIFALLSKREGEKVWITLLCSALSRDSLARLERERCIIVAKCAPGYRALMGGRSEK